MGLNLQSIERREQLQMLQLSPLHLTLGGHEEGWAVLFHQGLGCVDQWQTVGNGVLGQRILLCQKPATIRWDSTSLDSEIVFLGISSEAAILRKWNYCSSG